MEVTPKVKLVYQSLKVSMETNPDFKLNFLTVMEETYRDFGDLSTDDIILWCHHAYFSIEERNYWTKLIDGSGLVAVMKACQILYGKLIFEESCKQANIVFVNVENDYKNGGSKNDSI